VKVALNAPPPPVPGSSHRRRGVDHPEVEELVVAVGSDGFRHGRRCRARQHLQKQAADLRYDQNSSQGISGTTVTATALRASADPRPWKRHGGNAATAATKISSSPGFRRKHDLQLPRRLPGDEADRRPPVDPRLNRAFHLSSFRPITLRSVTSPANHEPPTTNDTRPVA
jgi:hypothetical protein